MWSLLKRWFTRPPDRVIHVYADTLLRATPRVYLRRWYLVPHNRWCNVYLHQFVAGAPDRAMHDHPWASVSLLLKGEMLEHWRKPGGDDEFDSRDWGQPRTRYIRWLWPMYRSARHAHRVELLTATAWTLFITGPKVRSWGFIEGQRWSHWRDYLQRRGLL